jgi:hypothetical protein
MYYKSNSYYISTHNYISCSPFKHTQGIIRLCRNGQIYYYWLATALITSQMTNQ